MKQSNKKPISLKTKAFRAILAGTLLLTLLISGAFFGLYVFDTLRNFHDEAENLMSYAMSMEDMTYIERIFKETREIYEGLPADVKKDPTSEAFMDAFRPRRVRSCCTAGRKQITATCLWCLRIRS